MFFSFPCCEPRIVSIVYELEACGANPDRINEYSLADGYCFYYQYGPVHLEGMRQEICYLIGLPICGLVSITIACDIDGTVKEIKRCTVQVVFNKLESIATENCVVCRAKCK